MTAASGDRVSEHPFRGPPWPELAAIEAAAAEHADWCWPEESLGVVRFVDGERRYVALRNVCPRPREGAEGDTEGAEAVLHSHPSGALWPSAADLAAQSEDGVPNAIVPFAGLRPGQPVWWSATPWRHDLPFWRAPLAGRPFLHGVSDCLTLVRDGLRQEGRGVDVVSAAYGPGWWREGHSLEDALRPAGWAFVSVQEAVPGDILRFRVRASVVNHVGLLRTDGQVLHHPGAPRPVALERLSRCEPLARWVRYLADRAIRPSGS